MGTIELDETHDPDLKSWVPSANRPESDFPIQNLPFGIFRKRGSREKPRGGVAIGDQIVDLAALDLETGSTLNELGSSGRVRLRTIRRELSLGLSTKRGQRKLERWLLPMAKAELFLPVSVGDYTDFYTSSYHATNIGRLFRPDNPLLPNFKWIPIAYHGRTSSIVLSGTPIRRPQSQLGMRDSPIPTFGPSKRLDYEAELGFIVGTGNRLGEAISISRALDHVFGVVLLNDWSARDIQAWEYQPLGPFLGKNFASTISPWVVTLDALEPFRVPAYVRPEGDPKPLPYLTDPTDQEQGMLSVDLEVSLRTSKMREEKKPASRLSRGNYASSYWTPAQMIAHHTANGCNLRPGDLLGSGTISGPTRDSVGALIELTVAGQEPVELPNGEKRGFLEDGDEVIQRGSCRRSGFASIGFGICVGKVMPAH